MEFRNEKSEKSKELIRKQFKSDIFNISTGYYKTENILPITSKPNELKYNINEFVPKYKEMKPSIRLFNDLLSHKQRRDYSFDYGNKNIKSNLTRQNSEVQILRGYTKIIRDNCFDEKGNFSARKRYRLEFYGKENINYKKLNKSFSYTIKDKRNKSYANLFKNSLYIQKNQNNKDKNIFSSETPRKSKNDINNHKFKSPQNDYKKMKNNINFTKIDKLNKLKSPSLQATYKKIKNEKMLFPHPKDIRKEFYTRTNHPIKSNKITIKNIDNDEKEYFDIEIKNDDIHNKEPLIDQKKLKHIFLKNGLHIYDFNDDGMNILSKDKKFEAKLRKNKKDENFDKNYRNVVRELNKINVKVNRRGIINETGFINKNVQRKRKGTPGKNLYKNKENKDENTKLNTGFTIKRDKYILPQRNLDYKNGYNYQMKIFNHSKKK
jgi:hypothetical protein